MRTFVTSTTLLNVSLQAVFPILSLGEPTRSNPDHKFIERFFPRNEDEVKSLFSFRKKQKRSVRMRNKKSSS